MEVYKEFSRVTSDCKPWKNSGCLVVCNQCHAVQKCVDETFLKEVEEIYGDYDAYYQSGGKEQVVFNEGNQAVKVRSLSILEAVEKKISMAANGRFLDIGCANGNMLETVSMVFPGWELFGFDLDEKNKVSIESIKNVKHYYSRKISHIKGTYDFISMVHVLEHIPDPENYLAKVRKLLCPEGRLIIELPNIMENPFDLLIADHCTHFTEERIVGLLKRAGFKVVFSDSKSIPKELTLVAKFCDTESVGEEIVQGKNILTYINQCMNWLKDIKNKMERIGKNGDIGIFGAGIASAWLISEFKEMIAFCVDEDKDKVGRIYCGIPVLHPENVYEKTVFVPMPFQGSKKIADRLSGQNGCRYIGTSNPGDINLD